MQTAEADRSRDFEIARGAEADPDSDSDLDETKDPVLITEHGAPSAYLVDVTAFEMMQDRMTILEGIARGERAILEGRTLTHAEARGRMKKWLA